MSSTRCSINAANEMPTHEDLLIDITKGPFARNLAIWNEGIELAKQKFYDGEFGIEDRDWVRYLLIERHWKMVKAAHLMMKNEFMKLCGETFAGISVLSFILCSLDKEEVSILILFHSGKVNFTNRCQVTCTCIYLNYFRCCLFSDFN